MVSAPSDVLHYPYPAEPIPAALNEVLQIGDWLSPSHVLLKGIDLVFGFNPGEEVATWVAGDWRGLAVGSSALGQLAEYAAVLGRDIDTARADLLDDWDGHAASAANAYFNQLARAVDALQTPLRGLASQYRTVSAGMLEMAAAVASILEALLDKLIEMGIKALAATATAETVVGGLFFGGWAAYDAYRATKLWTQALEWHGRAVTLANAMIGLCAGYLGALRGAEGLALPAAAYEHPAL